MKAPSAADLVPSRPGAVPAWAGLLLVAAAWLAHGGVLQGSWVLDDQALVRDHPAVGRGVGGLVDSFAADGWRGGIDEGAWRPLTIASFALESGLWRGDDGDLWVLGFHLTNLLLHGIAAVLLLALLGRVFPGRPLLASGSALLFAMHPMHSGTIATLAGRADLLALVLGLGGLLAWDVSARGRPALAGPALLLLLLALLAKEAALGFVPLAFLIDLRHRASWSLRRSALLALPLALYAVLLPAFEPATEGFLPATLTGVARAALSLVLPVDHPRDRLLADDTPLAAVVLGLVVLATPSLLLLPALRDTRLRPFLLGALATAVLAPLAALWAPPSAPLEIRFAYVACPGLFLLGGQALEAVAASRGGWPRPAPLAGAAVVFVALALLAWQESGRWRDDASLSQALLDAEPDNAAVLVRLADRLREQAERDAAFASTLPSTDPRHRRLVRGARARLDDAVRWLTSVVERPAYEADPRTWAALGRAWHARGDIPLAREALRRALDLDPWLAEDPSAIPPRPRAALADTFRRLGQVEEALGRPADAAARYERASQLAPGDVATLRRAGAALMRVGRFREALPLLERARDAAASPALRAEIDRELNEARRAGSGAGERAFREAQAAEAGAEYAQAVALYEAAIDADPGRVEAYERAAWIRGTWFGDYARGYALLDRAAAVLDERDVPADDTSRRRLALTRETLEAQQAEEEAEERREDGR